ncbi:MAG: hypothetical protein ABSG16_21730 [Candidatus Acidiferrum sp.]|jgi:PHD/YefM family antitoxin component YafN of YafNO toxin-antitoxin module
MAPEKGVDKEFGYVDITKNIQSLTTFRRCDEFMKQLKKSKRPVVLTVKGKAAAIVQDAKAYQRSAFCSDLRRILRESFALEFTTKNEKSCSPREG